MQKNSLIIIAPSVCSTGIFLTEGCRYTYKTGVRKMPVVLVKILEYIERLVLELYLIEEKRIIRVIHQYSDTPYLDYLRLFYYESIDYEYPINNDITEFSVEDKPMEKRTYSKEIFILSLTEKQEKEIIKHFYHQSGSQCLEETEYKLTYLAWLLGEKLLLARRGYLAYKPDVVDICLQEYNGLPHGIKLGIPDFEELRKHYNLDLLYKNAFVNEQ